MPKYALIAIIDYPYPLLSNEPHFHLYNTFRAENAPHLKMSEQLQVHLVSLHRFRELGLAPGTDLNNWMHYYSSAYMDPEEAKGLISMTEDMRGMEQTYRRVVQDPEVLRQYDYERLLREDYLARVYEFREEGKIEMAKAMLTEGDSVEKVARISGLPLDKILELQKERAN